MATRLDSRAPDLTRMIEAAPGDRQRQVAVRIAESALALTSTSTSSSTSASIQEPELELGLAELRGGCWGGAGGRGAAQLSERLDGVAWDIQDQVDEGTAEEQEYVEAFCRARALSALAFALDADPRTAALEAAYEAEAATENLALIRSIVIDVLGGAAG